MLINLAGIKDPELLHKAEADITNLTMTGIYNQRYEKFNTDTLKDIHRTVFGQIYDWVGEFRTIQIVKPEDVLGGNTLLHDEGTRHEISVHFEGKYEKIGDYLVRDDKERPHEYQDDEKSRK